MGCCGFGPVKEAKNQRRQCKACKWFVGTSVEVLPDGSKETRDVCSNPNCPTRHRRKKQ